MEQAYQTLRREQPGLMPPSKPVKAEISVEDRKKEEDELAELEREDHDDRHGRLRESDSDDEIDSDGESDIDDSRHRHRDHGAFGECREADLV